MSHSIFPTSALNVTWKPRNDTQKDLSPFASRLSENVTVGFLLVISFYLSLAASWYQFAFGQIKLKWTNRLCTVAALSLLFEGCWFEIEINGTLSDTACQVYVGVSVVMLVFNKSFAYLVFWIRQRSFYNLPTLQINSLLTRSLSSATLVGIILLSLLQIVFHLLYNIRSSPKGCVLTQSVQFVSTAVPLTYALFVLCQLMLLGLVLYPMIKYWRRPTRVTKVNVIVVAVRLSVCTIVSVITDFAFLALSMRRPSWASFTFVPSVYSLNAVINTVALYASFADYRRRFFTIPRRSSLKKRNRTHSTITTIQ